MHLLIIDDEISDRSRITCFTDVLNFYLCRELRRRGVDLSYVEGGTEAEPASLRQVRQWSLAGIDHVLALGLRYFTRTEAASILVKRFRGAVTQLHEGALKIKDVDCTFTIRDDSYVFVDSRRDWAQCNRYVGWAADHELIHPAQIPGELCILLDHESYDPRDDRTQAIVESAAQFAKSDAWRSKYESIVVRQLVNGGAMYVDLDNPVSGHFSRQHIPFEEICKEYGRASLYMVMHQESVGLTCLETAMAGALVAAPNDFIPRDRLGTIRHVEYDGDVPWQLLIDNIDVQASRDRALQNSWNAVADHVLDYFDHFKRR